MKGLLDDYVKGFIVQMQDGKNPLMSSISFDVLCTLIAHHRDDFVCQICAGTNRCPIPLAEVMNVRRG